MGITYLVQEQRPDDSQSYLFYHWGEQPSQRCNDDGCYDLFKDVLESHRRRWVTADTPPIDYRLPHKTRLGPPGRKDFRVGREFFFQKMTPLGPPALPDLSRGDRTM